MKKLWVKFLGLFTMALVLAPKLVLAAGGGDVAPLVIVADTRKLTGIMAWWANMYNESHVEFTILTVILIPTIGLLFGVLADLVMSHIGIDLKHRELSEH
jgi:hypothetical protein